MKRSMFYLSGAMLLLAGTLALSFVNKKGIETLKPGDKAPKTDLGLVQFNGETTTLDQLKKENGLMVVFSCNTCPFVLAWEDRYNLLYEEAAANNIGMVLVNSNEAKRDGADSPKAMITHAREKGYKAPYVIDENHKLADAFGAKTTPHVFLFDGDMVLQYVGAIDDNFKSASDVAQSYAVDAISQLGQGLEIEVKTSPAKGCSIKRIKS